MANNEEVVEMLEGKGKKPKKGKKIIFIAGALIAISIGGFVCGYSIANSKEAEKPSVSDTNKEDEEELSYKYVLYKPIDYSKEAEIDSLISEINKHVEGEPLTKDFFNLLTKDITKEQFGNMSDEEISVELDSIQYRYFELLSSNIDAFVREKDNTVLPDSAKVDIKKTDKLAISGFNFIDKNSYAHETYQKRVNALIEKELNDIRNSNTSEYLANAQEYYDIVKEVLKDKNLNSEPKNRALILINLTAIRGLFTNVLIAAAPEKYKEISNDFANPSFVAWTQKVISDLGLVIGVDLTKPQYESKVSDKYNSNDANSELAKAYKGAVIEGKKTTITSNDVKTESEKIEEATTGKLVTSTTTHKVPEEESKKSETTSIKDNSNVTVGKPIVSEGTTEKITEEDVKPETEPESWTYKDSEGDEWVVTPDDNGDYIFDNDQWNKVNGNAKTLK